MTSKPGNSLLNLWGIPGLLFLISYCSLYCSLAISSEQLPIFDSHSHYKTEDASLFGPKDIIAIMDRENITRMVIVGEPAERAQALYQYAPDRIIPFLGLYDGYQDKADWMLDDELPARLEAALKSGQYRGIGEIHLFKKDRENDNLKAVIGLADKCDLPVLFHGDAEVVQQIFKMYPGITVIWAHLGTIPSPALLTLMLKRYPDGLYIDTSVRDQTIAPNNKLSSRWREFFISHPDRVMVGIDTFYTPRWENIHQVTSRIRQWLAALPEPVARKLAYENANKLFTSAPGNVSAKTCR